MHLPHNILSIKYNFANHGWVEAFTFRLYLSFRPGHINNLVVFLLRPGLLPRVFLS